MVDNLSMCFRDYSSSSTSAGKNSNQNLAENKTHVEDNTSNTKKIEDIKVKKDNSVKNNFDEDDIDQNLRRVTRGLTKINKSVNENFLGRLVWGCCSGWWPALIIDAEHVGMISEPGKLWVYWIGDSLISLLNERTQIKPFTDNLELRLKQKSESADSMQSIDLTIQMIREKCGCLLTKPYHIWVQKNFIDKTKKEIKFYPYPAKIQERLDFLKEKNSRINERYMLNQKQQSSEKTKRQVEKCTDTSFNEKNTELLPLMEQRPGVIAWAKIAGYNWWPAMIIDYRDCCLREPSFGCQWIMWYGDYTFSQIHHRAFMKFIEGMEKMQEYIQRTKKHFYLLGVLDASKDYYLRLGYDTENWTIADAITHSSQRNVCSQVRKRSLTVQKCSEESKKYSALILSKLNQLKINVTVDDQRKNDIINSNILHLIKIGKAAIEDICLRCLKISQEEMEQHPFFKGSLCKDCSEIFKPSIFVIGTDSKCYFCTVCAGSGTVVMCDNENCPRVYCTACLKHLIYPNEYHDILLEDPWKCLLCKMDNVSTPNRVILPRPEWKEKFTHMFRTNPNSKMKFAIDNNWVKRKMRVLSLFDGLATGLVVLLKLGITIEVYYASEIDKDALTVSSSHFGDRIIYLGDVRDITVQKIKEIAPIDLVMGGSPCNDLSLVNPARLGLHDPNGTGVLFFEYKRIKELVKKANNGRHLFWLYENVANMETKYRLEINRCLGQEPDVIDSADFSPQHRLRLYWHNLPINAYTLPSENQHDLQDVLTPHCNRYALVKKIRTVTTNVHSLKQGKLALKPILMKDESDLLWITELEEIFGFPRHYTDVKNLSADKRQKLIGKSWSVQTLSAIFLPLRSLYEHD
ncbi:DNA (cytosine-5)-methyltransferase 3B-like isoform X2 [Vespula pensylvanica]|uniref:DNA (cytosine-5)-methyltransferase 3B-like isoform X2 n=1 Tax=Vespula pensylvanica TaxID=30213 RepID=UPI001CBA4CF5|nr:DNA (cytosine-5)-methyltransferase 3B-like isoform X2 [Vespula pensylvanica]